MVDPHRVLVTAAQMQAIEQAMFAAGMPPAALMEKAALAVAQRMAELSPRGARVGVLVGPGHNGGDAWVVARELHWQGWRVTLHQPLPSAAPLPQAHARYGEFLGLADAPLAALAACDWLVDGLLGLGTTRPPAGPLAAAIAQVNAWPMPKVAIDVPSGLDSDRGVPLGETLRADRTLCLGLWKRGLWQEAAVPYVGALERLDWGVPAHLVPPNSEMLMDAASALTRLAGDRPLPQSHKYQNGRLLVVAGSRRFGGPALLALAGGRGVGMLYAAVPQTLQPLIWQRFPEAVVLPCPETATGAIAALPPLDWAQFDAIAAGPGLTLDTAAFADLWQAPLPLVADADFLRYLATIPWAARPYPTVLTPHTGEFSRLFPDLATADDRLQAVTQAAHQTGAIVLHKGHRTVVSDGQQTAVNPESTAALARGGSGDVLTGAIGALLARGYDPWAAAVTGTLWHAHTACHLAERSSDRSVDPLSLAHTLYQP